VDAGARRTDRATQADEEGDEHMSRSGYSDDFSGSELGLYRASVERAIGGKRGQKFLREMLVAFDALPIKRLAEDTLVTGENVCAMGAVALARGVDVSEVSPEDRDEVGRVFDIAPSMAAEIAYMNDECGGGESDEDRFVRMREWARRQLREESK
jgi:hypothetical protein